MSYKLKLSSRAKRDHDEFQQSGDTKKLEKIAALFDELEEHPTTGTGKLERLKYNLSGEWSRRIDQEHRIVYTIDHKNKVVAIKSLKHHYKE
jgi:toxin YoeB